MRILVIEDEPLVAQSLIKVIRQLEPEAEISGPISSIKETVKWLENNPRPELIMADIQLSDGISFDIFSGTENLCPIIFTTAYDEYAIRAFKLNSIDYLLKPIDKLELKAAFNKFHLLQHKYTQQVYLDEVMQVFKNFNNTRKYKERFAVHFGRAVTLVGVANVAYFCKEEIIHLVSSEGKKFITDYRSLDEVEEETDPALFFRVNRQNLVNLEYIESFATDEVGRVIIKLKAISHHELAVSKDRAAQFRQWVEEASVRR